MVHVVAFCLAPVVAPELEVALALAPAVVRQLWLELAVVAQWTSVDLLVPASDFAMGLQWTQVWVYKCAEVCWCRSDSAAYEAV